MLSLYGESIYLATSLSQDKIEDKADYDWLYSDGIIEVGLQERSKNLQTVMI